MRYQGKSQSRSGLTGTLDAIPRPLTVRADNPNADFEKPFAPDRLVRVSLMS
jgi:hypothetical protein